MKYEDNKKNYNYSAQEKNLYTSLEDIQKNDQENFVDALSDPMRIELKERAAALSKESVVESEVPTLEVLEFQLEQEKYGIEAFFIHKVHPLRDLTYLPGVPVFIIGMVNLRGTIIPVLDLRKLFDFPVKEEQSSSNRVVVVAVDQAIFGILITEITGMSSIAVNQLQTELPTLTGIRADFIKGVTKQQLVILDPIKMASDKRILVDFQM